MARNELLNQPEEFERFCNVVDTLYNRVCKNRGGQLPEEVSQLTRWNGDHFGVALCTVNGIRYSVGDSSLPFSIESLCKAFNYALAVNKIGSEIVHSYIGHESAGYVTGFIEVCLNQYKKPHNPLTDSGGVVLVSLLNSNLPLPERFDQIFNQYKEMAGGSPLGFSNSFYLNAKRTLLDHLLAVGHFTRDAKAFPTGCKMKETLDLYLQFCSIEASAEACAAMAATLANGGICPMTGQRILNPESVRNCLSLMASCGMGGYSGQFAFKVGLPAKSSVTGAIILIIPSILGICVWSPPVDDFKNSVRGVEFCELLVEAFRLHKFDYVASIESNLMGGESREAVIATMLFAAAKANLGMLRQFHLQDTTILSKADRYGRTALHLASAEGHFAIVKFLVEKGDVPIGPRDRWDISAIDEATRNNNSTIVEYLNSHQATTADGGVASSNGFQEITRPLRQGRKRSLKD